MKGVHLHQLPQDDGSDIEMEEEEMDKVGNDVDAALTLLWKQFIQDVMQKVPNRKSMDDTSYCKLTEEIQANPSDSLYKNICLSDFFNDCQWRLASGAEWSRTFSHLFPLETKSISVQNYYTTRYYPMWEKIKEKAVEEGLMNAILSALKSKFDELMSQVGFSYPTIPFCPHCPIFFVPLPPLFLCPHSPLSSSPLSLISLSPFHCPPFLCPSPLFFPIVYCSYNTFPLSFHCPIVPFHYPIVPFYCPIVIYCTLFLLVYIQ